MRTAIPIVLAGALSLFVLASPAAAVEPDDLGMCGYHSLPLIMEQRPQNSPMYGKNFNAIDTINDYLEILQYSNFESGWGINGANEFGAVISSSQLEDAWYWTWSEINAVAVEMSLNWCGYGCCEKIESDIAFNSNFTWVYEPIGVFEDPQTWYYPRILLHELCHAWGIEPESGNYDFPTIMLPMARDAYPDERLIHIADAWLLRTSYDDQVAVQTMRNLVVVSKYVHPTQLRWKRTNHYSWTPVSPGMVLDVENLTIENTGTEDLYDVHVRFYLRPWGTDEPGQLLSDHVWDEFPAGGWGIYSFFDMEIPFYIETGTYEVRVHVTMNGYQEDDRAVDSWASLVQPLEVLGRSIEVTSPGADANLYIGDVVNITWESDNVPLTSDLWIEISRNEGATWSPIARVDDTGSYEWTVFGPPSDDCLIRVTPSVFYQKLVGVSEPFSINGNYIRVDEPNGGEVLTPGSTAEIRWLAVGAGDLVDLDVNCIGGWQSASPSPVAAEVGVYDWQVPDTTSNTCTVKVRSVDNPGIEDISDEPFTITDAAVEVNTPVADETVYIGDVVPVEFDYDGTCGYLNVRLSRSPSGPFETAGQVSATADSWPWLVVGPSTTWARFMLQDACDPTAFGVSGVFTITNRRIRVESPNGGEAWTAGQTETVTWSSEGAGDTVGVYLERYGSDPAEFVITSSTPNDGSYTFVPQTHHVGNAYWVKVNSKDYPDLEDWSDEPFAIEPSLQIISPNGGEHLISGEVQTLKWTDGAAFSMKRLAYKVSGGPWHTITSATTASGEHPWQVPQLPNGTQIRWRVSRVNSPDVEDISDGPIAIVSRSLSVYAPAGGEVFTPGQSASVRWTSNLAGHNVVVSESCNDGASWDRLTGSITNNGSVEVTVVPPRRDGCKVRVASTSFPELFDLSEGLYSVANSPPIAVDNIVNGFEDQRAGVDVLADDSDADGDELELVNFSQPDSTRDPR